MELGAGEMVKMCEGLCFRDLLLNVSFLDHQHWLTETQKCRNSGSAQVSWVEF